MVALASAFVRIRPQVDRTEFRREGEKAGEEGGTAAGKAFGEGFYRDAAGRVRRANGQFATDSEKAAAGFERSGRKAGIAFGKGLDSTFTKVAKIAASRYALIGASAAAAAPGVLHLGAALAPTVGALTAAPAAVASFATALGVLKIAAGGAGNAINEGLVGSAEKYEKALDGLPPAAQRAVKSVVALKGPILDVRNIISERFFAPFISQVNGLASIYLPLARAELGRVASSLGGVGAEVAKAAKRTEVISGLRDTFRQTAVSAGILRTTVQPLAAAIGVFLSTTSTFLPGISTSLADIVLRFSAFLTEASRTGQVTAAFNAARTALQFLNEIASNVGSIFGSVFAAANAGGNNLLETFRDLTGVTADFLLSAQGVAGLTAVFTTLGSLGDALKTSLGAVLPAIADALVAIGPAIAGAAGPASQLIVAVAPLLPALAGIAATVVTALTPALAVVAGYLAQNEGLVKALAAAFVAYKAAAAAAALVTSVQAAGGLLAYARATTIATTATRIASAAQYVFGAALRFALGPIGLIITAIGLVSAAVIYLYKNNETFRNIVMAVWSGIKTAITAVGAWFTGTLVPSLVRAYDQLKAVALFLWQNVILPAWNGIKAAISGAWTVIKAIFGFFSAAFTAIGTAVSAVYNTVIAPIFRVFAKAVEIWWFAVRIIFTAFKNIFVAAVTATIERARTVFEVVFAAIRGYVALWWEGVKVVFGLFRTYILGPVIGALQAAAGFFARVFAAIGRTVSGWYTATIQPVFAAVGRAFAAVAAAFSNVYNNKIKPLFEQFIGFIKDKVVKGFETGVSAIKAAWEKVKAAAKTPVAFVVNKVINPFIGGLNKAAAIVGLKDKIEPITGFAHGGQIPGPAVTRDNRLAKGPNGLLAVMSREFIVNAKSTMQNLGLVSAINAKRGKVTHADVDPYLDGGGGGDGIGSFFSKLIDGAKGIGEFIADPKKAIQKIANGVLSKVPGGGFVRDTVIGAGKRLLAAVGTFVGKAGLGGGIGKAGISGGWRAMQRLIAQRFPDLSLISGYRAGARTLSGNPSYHGKGRAVDYPPVRALAAWIRTNFGAKTKELITPFQDLNLLNGQPHTYTGAVWNQHNFAGGNAHVHWAAKLGGLIDRMSGMPVTLFDKGGWWPSGTLGANMSGRAEYVNPPGRKGGGGDIIIQRGAFTGAVVANSQQAEDLVVTAINSAKRKKRIP